MVKASHKTVFLFISLFLFNLLPAKIASAAEVVGDFTPLCQLPANIPAIKGYGWPVKPFGQQHAIRGNFNDPRFAGSKDIDEATSKAFHFGVDIAAPDGEPVYAIEDGKVNVSGGQSIAIVSGDKILSYWHIDHDKTIKDNQQISANQQVGYIGKGWGHVHLAEAHRNPQDQRVYYVNPLRSGALGPYQDYGIPKIESIKAYSESGSTVSLNDLKGKVNLTVQAFDSPPLALPSSPEDWAGAVMTPAIISWNVKNNAGETIMNDRQAVNFSEALCRSSEFEQIYASETIQNGPSLKGNYNFYLVRNWDTTQLENGQYEVNITAQDHRGNVTNKKFGLVIQNGGESRRLASSSREQVDEVLKQFNSANPGSGIVAIDLSSNQQNSVNGDGQLTAASLYKLYVAEFLYFQKRQGKLNFGQKFPLADVDRQWKENKADCKTKDDKTPCVTKIWPAKPTGQSANANECLPKMIIYSDNICGKTFLDWARLNGLYAYLSSRGYDQTSLAPGNLQTSANDVAKLLAAVAEEKLVTPDASQDLYVLMSKQAHRNKIPAGVSPAETANKTGEIHPPGGPNSHDAAIVKSAGKVYVIVILTQLNPDLPANDTKIADLAKAILNAFAGNAVFDEDDCVTVEGSASIYEILQAPFYERDTECGGIAGDGTEGADIIIDGYAFPIAAKAKSDLDHFNGALNIPPCNSSSGCHHPDGERRGGFAWDLGIKGYGPDRSENAPVYAITDGTIERIDRTRNGATCNSFQLVAVDGYSYWYGHLAPDTSINDGQKVVAGQPVGKVGPYICADRTAPHVHIDRGFPKGKGGGRACCRDAGIIPLINKLYAALPE